MGGAEDSLPGVKEAAGAKETGRRAAESLKSHPVPQSSAAEEDPGSSDEILVFVDPGTGATQRVEKKYTIRDLTTGKLFVLGEEGQRLEQATGGRGGGGPGGEDGAAASSSGPGTATLVTDVSSGQAMSLVEFDQALGLHSALKDARRRRRESRGGESSSSDEGQKRPAPKRNGSKHGPGNWLKDRLFSRRGGLGPTAEGAESDASSASPEPRSVAGSVFSLSRDSLSGEGDRRLRVQVHHKTLRELSDLRLVQEVSAHEGVIWTMKFSKNGRFLASAGQDRTVRVWEVVGRRGAVGPEEQQQQQREDGRAPAAAPPGGGGAANPPGGGAANPPGAAAAAGAARERSSAAAPAEARSPTAEENERLGARVASSGPSASGSVAGLPPELAVLKAKAYRSYVGHSADVLDLAWSKSQFLLTASMDKTVRLWHISMDDCLRTFKHTDFVTALDFHPVDDKYFISGSIDGKVRVWNIPDQRVVDWADVHEMVTACAFAPDGKRAVVGTMKGHCRFYAAEGFRLEYRAQIDVKNRRSNAARARKITGLQFVPHNMHQLLVTSNDSRIRLYDGYTLRTKFKGHQNRNTQIRATFSPAGDFLICGSDNGWAYVWPSESGPSGDDPPAAPKQEKSACYEAFHAHDDIVTVAVFAPETATRQNLVPTPVRLPTSPRALGLDAFTRLVSRGRWSREEAAAAARAEQDVIASQRALGQVMLTAGYNGDIRVFENMSLPVLA